MSSLAERYNISDVAHAKACRKLLDGGPMQVGEITAEAIEGHDRDEVG
jgi:hypothetical protein